MSYPNKPNTLLYLIGQAFFYYWKTLKAIFPVIIMSTIIQEAILYSRELQYGLIIVRILIYFIIVLLFTFIWSVALYRTDRILKSEPVAFNTACRWIFDKISSIFLGIFTFILGISALFFIGYFVVHIITLIVGKSPVLQTILPVFIIGFPLIFGLILFYFALPLLILEPINVWPAFRQSAQLVGTGIHWMRTFFPYAITILLIIVFIPETHHMLWLHSHHVSFLFDLLVLSIVAPLLLNLIVLLLNDLRIRGDAR